jgi:DNA-binding GntR family transcriptional regulator
MAKPAVDSSIRVVGSAPSLRELTTRTLRDAILRMHFKPGQRLIERKLCADTGVSRTCIREALRQLEAEGLIERSPTRRVSVAAVSPDEARQIYEVRAALEAEFARRFVERATDADIAALQAAVDAVARHTRRQPVTFYVQALDGFYDVLLRGADNDVARGLLRTLRARMSYLRALTAVAADPDRERETLVLMQEIVAAAERRDGRAMAKLCRSFVERSARYAISVLSDQERGDGSGQRPAIVRASAEIG